MCFLQCEFYRLYTLRFPLMAEFIYTMKKARKAHGDKVILD
ncbi:MAG: hypothetical protein RL126_989, partial [Actinomycetota bacterium]